MDRIRPAIDILMSRRDETDPDVLMRDAVRANVRAAVSHLTHGSALLERLSTHDGLLVVGAEYSLESGVVTFLEGAARTG